MQLDDRRITNNLTRRRSQLITLVLLRFEQEVQLLQCLPVRFREKEVDEDDFKAEPYDVYDQVLPANIVEADGVDEGASMLSVSSPDEETLGSGGNIPNMTAVLPKS